MGTQPGHSQLVPPALENARRVAETLRRQGQDLAQKMPGEAQGGEALRNAASAARRVAELLEERHAPAVPSPPPDT